jgi:signal peptidase I
MSSNQKNNKNLFLRFLNSNNTKVSIIKDVFFALLFVMIILVALWAYTGQWFSVKPMVAIESNSMAHENEPFGRIGTINAGDMVLLVKVDTRSDIVTRGSQSVKDNPSKDLFQSYGEYGDVIVYKPYGIEGDQIIHRAMCWVDVHTYDGNITYSVQEYGIYNEDSITIPDLGLHDYEPDHEGFITMGDNNRVADQSNAIICSQPVKVEWISGKARGEIPWIGIIKLVFNDMTTGADTLGNVQRDCFDCFILLLNVLVLIPISLDILSYYKNKKQEFLKHNFKIQKDISNLGLLTVWYWGVMFVLFAISYFLLGYPISRMYHFIIILFVHVLFLFFLELDGKILQSKNMSRWLLLTAFTGPIGMTIFYLYESSSKNK